MFLNTATEYKNGLTACAGGMVERCPIPSERCVTAPECKSTLTTATRATAERCQTRFALFPLTRDEDCTCKSLLEKEPSARLTLMPTHHMDESGDLTGFRYDCDAHAQSTCLPLSRRMFFGHSVVECQVRCAKCVLEWRPALIVVMSMLVSVKCTDNISAQVDERTILRLMMNGERNHQHMRSFLSQLEERCLPATLECMPDNTDAMTGHGLLRGMDLRTVDCSDWTPEVPEQIGIYHAYLRGFNRDVRTHRLFVVCSGGLERACDAFCNLMIDVGQKCTAEARVFFLFLLCCFVFGRPFLLTPPPQEVAESEEAWWLRRACQRSRTRTMKLLAEHFGLKVPCMQV